MCNEKVVIQIIDEWVVNQRINGKYRHGITLIGYNGHIDGNYISVWNSAKENFETLREGSSYGYQEKNIDFYIMHINCMQWMFRI